MSERIKYIVSMDVDGFKKGATEANKALSQMQQRMETTAKISKQKFEEQERAAKEAAAANKKYGEDVKKAFTTIAVTAAAAGVALKKIYDMGKAGAGLEFTAIKFDRLAESIGTTGDALRDDLADATDGLMSKAEQMQLAGDLMSLGLAKTHDEAVRLSTVASQLGMNMNQLVLTLTNQTTMRFDALGIAVDGFDDKVAKLKQTGMSASDAFKEAFMQQAEEQLRRVGSIAETNAGKFMRFEAQIKDIGDAFKMSLAAGVADVVEGIYDYLEAQEKISENFDKLSGDIDKSTMSMKEYNDAVLLAALHSGRLTEHQYLSITTRKIANEQLRTLMHDMGAYTNETEYFKDKWAELGDLWMFRVVPAGEKTREIFEGILAPTEALGDELLEGLNPALKDNAEAAARAAIAEQEFAEALGSVNRNILNQIDSWKKNIEWITSGAYELQLQAEAIMESVRSSEDYEEVQNRLTKVQDLLIQKSAAMNDMSMQDIQGAYESIGYEIESSAIKAAELYYKNQDINKVSLGNITQSLYNMGVPWERAAELAAAILGHLRAIDGTTATAKIVIDTYNNQHGVQGTSGAQYGSGSPSRPQPSDDIPTQAGGDFIVPPSFAGDTFPVRATAGERVQVTPKSGTTTELINSRQEARRNNSELARMIADAILIGMRS